VQPDSAVKAGRIQAAETRTGTVPGRQTRLLGLAPEWDRDDMKVGDQLARTAA